LEDGRDEGYSEFVVLARRLALEIGEVGRPHVLGDQILCDRVHRLLREEWPLKSN